MMPYIRHATKHHQDPRLFPDEDFFCSGKSESITASEPLANADPTDEKDRGHPTRVGGLTCLTFERSTKAARVSRRLP